MHKLSQGSIELVGGTRERDTNPRSQECGTSQRVCGAIGWSLTDDEVAELRSLASEINPVVGFPVEYL
ncbi:hypothetical protein Bca52824_074264 [Brassica carinata]|uniref:Uncharacterized protein n=1 Tax=Brassica carinata TaxID=52824 RepID=A0A8X7TUB6_BRACI|nr:hypothetical protein Bca52824_074264 [Brassica carinata]